MEQGWSDQIRQSHHHISQGTLTFGMPYQWLVALEAPERVIRTPPRLLDPVYADRFGFIPGRPGQVLPVGFAKGAPMVDPVTGAERKIPGTGEPAYGVGFTCAACHTGRLTYRGKEYLIDGGSAMVDLGKFRDALSASIARTFVIPGRFDRFAEAVLGQDPTPAARDALWREFTDLVERGRQLSGLESWGEANGTREGFGRLDALNRIGNEVFAYRLMTNPRKLADERTNFAPYTAPVHYPPIWTAPWYLWVQYNGSIMQPMVRNAGEALGVRALVNMIRPGPTLWDSSVDFRNLVTVEEWLAGPRPPREAKRFTGLQAPKWPAEFPPVDRALAQRGARLYQDRCQGCHLPAPNTEAFWKGPWWVKAPAGPGYAGRGNAEYLNLVMVPAAVIGTDPEQARGMAERTVSVPPELGTRSTSFPLALGEVVEKTVARGYDRMNPVPTRAERERMNGSRPNSLRADVAYKARILSGVWATPPYLHNGSVPTIAHLLGPASERPGTFTLGNREYDPQRLGYRTDKIDGGFELDTTKPGNSNRGHEFSDTPGPGVIGPALSVDDRAALVEYLKTL